MATQKEIQAIAKKAKKELALKNKQVEEEKEARSKQSLLAISNSKEVIEDKVEEVKSPTKNKKITEDEEIAEL